MIDFDEEDVDPPNFGLTDRDHLSRLVSTIDWDLQLEAIEDVFDRNKKALASVAREIEESGRHAETYNGPHQDHVVNEHVDALHRAVYSDAAISLSAVGMIVPMLESVLSQTFQGLGKLYEGSNYNPPDHKRWHLSSGDDARWNCQIYFGKEGRKNDIVGGINQLAKATGLVDFLNNDIMNWIGAMFSYRNYIFHGGFEWSIEARAGFEKLISDKGWQDYFTSARSNNKPWVFYLSDKVIDGMVPQMESILDSLGRFAQNLPSEFTAVRSASSASI